MDESPVSDGPGGTIPVSVIWVDADRATTQALVAELAHQQARQLTGIVILSRWDNELALAAHLHGFGTATPQLDANGNMATGQREYKGFATGTSWLISGPGMSMSVDTVFRELSLDTARLFARNFAVHHRQQAQPDPAGPTAAGSSTALAATASSSTFASTATAGPASISTPGVY